MSRWLGYIVPAVIVLIAALLLIPAILREREAARLSQSKNNRKQIGLALHNYQDAFNSFPAGGVISAEGTAMHGWYTFILPYLDASPLYNYVNFKRPWDDLENAWALRTVNPHCLIAGVESIVAGDGFGSMHYMGNPNVFHRNPPLSIKDMTAGNSHSWFAGEVAGQYQPWSYPFNWRPLKMASADFPEGFGRPTGDGAALLMADGSVRFVSNNIDAVE